MTFPMPLTDPTTATLEEWRKIPDYEYEVSSLGQVRSLPRNNTFGRILKSQPTGGYSVVTLSRDNNRKTFRVHVLVAKAFLGQRPNGLVINHKDFDKLNNRVENLEWVTQRQNIDHNMAHSRHLYGVKNPAATLTEDQVRQIRRLAESGELYKEIGSKFNISGAMVSNIHHRKNWRSVA